MHVDRIPNRTSPPAFLLRETYREGGKVKKRTLANITHWPGKIEALRRLLRDAGPQAHAEPAPRPCRGRARHAAQARPRRSAGAGPTTERAHGRARHRPGGGAAARSSLQAHHRAAARRHHRDLFARHRAGARQGRRAGTLRRARLAPRPAGAHRNRAGPTPSQRWHAGALRREFNLFRRADLRTRQFGHNRDGKSGKLQIVFGLLCTKDGCPVAIEVFDGNVADPATLANQVKKLKERFALERVVLVGDRGMITEARIEEVLKPAGLDWITTLRAPAIRGLAEAGSLQLSLFDERDLATTPPPDYPGERLVACRNPLLADERARKREDLLVATEKKLAAIAACVHRAKKPLRGKDKIALAIGRHVAQYKMAKHFDLNMHDDRLHLARTRLSTPRPRWERAVLLPPPAPQKRAHAGPALVGLDDGRPCRCARQCRANQDWREPRHSRQHPRGNRRISLVIGFRHQSSQRHPQGGGDH